MKTKELSPREKEIVELCCEGLTNDAIAYRLGLSVGTVNTYWLRIKQKTGGFGKADTVVKVVQEKSDSALEEQRVDWEGLANILAQRGKLDLIAQVESNLQYSTAIALLDLALDHLGSTVWSTDNELVIHIVANGELLLSRSGVKLEEGKTVYEIFGTTDNTDPAVAAHLNALDGKASTVILSGAFTGMQLKVNPLTDEQGEVVLCISILSVVK